MLSLAVHPGQSNTVHVQEVPTPALQKEGEVLIHGIQAGICGTDREINEGLYGTAPAGSEFLILGHESFGEVVSTASSNSKFHLGEKVIRIVRRPCPQGCLSCRVEQSDHCLTGDFLECGIKQRHGCLVQYFVEEEKYLVPVPPAAESVGVLMEPMSFVQKVTRRAKIFLGEFLWPPKRAVVVGSGTIGILQTLVLRSLGVEVYTVARSPRGSRRSDIVERAGAKYLSAGDRSLKETMGPHFQANLIVEASGSAGRVPEAIELLAPGGVLCLTSITGGHLFSKASWDEINFNLVLGNRTIVGVVNSNRSDFEQAGRSLESLQNLWPGLPEQLITKQVDFDSFLQAFQNDPQEIKVAIRIP